MKGEKPFSAFIKGRMKGGGLFVVVVLRFSQGKFEKGKKNRLSAFIKGGVKGRELTVVVVPPLSGPGGI